MIRSILVVDTMGGLGDLVLALPMIEALGRSHPSARLTVVTTAPWHVLLQRDPGIAEVVPVHGRDGDVVAATVARALARIRPDLAVTTNRQHGLPELLSASGRRAVTDLWRSPPADEPVDLRMLRLLVEDGVVDAAFARLPPRLRLDEEEVATGAAVLDDLRAARPLLLFPDSGMAVKQWPLSRWAALVADPGGRVPVVVSQVAAQRDRLAAAGAAVAPPLGIRALAGLCAAAARRDGVAVGGDTGPVRVASASGLRVVGLFGPTLAARYGYRDGTDLQGLPECPVRIPTAITEQECWWTARCPLTADHAPACMGDIHVDAVRSAVSAAGSARP